MKKHFYLLMFVSVFLFKTAAAQRYYIVVVDRINDQITYKEKTFVKGRPVEKDINQPYIKSGDVITVRMVNFNELIYGLEVEGEAKEKPEGPLSKILDAGSAAMSFTGYSTSANLVMDLMRNAPALNTRGESGSSLSMLNTRMTTLAKKIAQTQIEMSDALHDEGASHDEIKGKIDLLDEGFDTTLIMQEWKNISTTSESLDSSDKESMRMKSLIKRFDPNEINQTIINLDDSRKLVTGTDFIQERTIVVNEMSNENLYEKFVLKILIYKRANPIKSADELPQTKAPYSKDAADYLNQAMVLKMKIGPKKNSIYFSAGVNKIFFTERRYTYGYETNNEGDSTRIVANGIGSSATTFGMHINYDLPLSFEKVKLAANLGYFVSINNTNNYNVKNRGYLTTGASIRLQKAQFVSFHAGAAWSKFQQLSNNYKLNQWYSGYFTQQETDNISPEKIKLSFYAGFSINL